MGLIPRTVPARIPQPIPQGNGRDRKGREWKGAGGCHPLSLQTVRIAARHHPSRDEWMAPSGAGIGGGR